MTLLPTISWILKYPSIARRRQEKYLTLNFASILILVTQQRSFVLKHWTL